MFEPEEYPDLPACGDVHTSLDVAIPDIERLVAWVLDNATMAHSHIHGETHWQSVGRMGIELVERGVVVAPAPILIFALLHDSQRHNDQVDPEHGPRAARLVEPARAQGLVVLTDAEAQVLEHAIRVHNGGPPTLHGTVGACQDSDRLTLGRILIEPDPRFLSHEVSRDQAFIDWACSNCHFETPWVSLYERLRQAAPRDTQG